MHYRINTTIMVVFMVTLMILGICRLILLWYLGVVLSICTVIFQVMGFGLFLIDNTPVKDTDGREVNINKLDSKKRISLNKIDKIFKVGFGTTIFDFIAYAFLLADTVW